MGPGRMAMRAARSLFENRNDGTAIPQGKIALTVPVHCENGLKNLSVKIGKSQHFQEKISKRTFA